MDASKMETIKQLMEELIQEMGPTKEDFSQRLGKEMPVEVEMSVESEDPMGEEMEDEMCESPEDKLKQRIMKMRG